MRKPFAQAAKGDGEIRCLPPHLYSPTRAARALVRTLRVELEARPTSGLRQRTLYRRPKRQPNRYKSVLRLQLALRSGGFARIPTRGRYGAATADVIKVIQKSRHLKRTGEVNAEFWKALQAGKIIATTVVVKKPIPKPVSKTPNTHTKGEKALAFAKKQLGDPYVRNAAGPTAGTAPASA